MIKRLYVDNFRTLVDFTYHPDSLQLLLGRNGSGKSAILEVLNRLRQFVGLGWSASDVFHAFDRTRWRKEDLLRFELDIRDGEKAFEYRLVLRVPYGGDEASVVTEELICDSRPLVSFREGKLSVFRDDGSEAASFRFGQLHSAVSFLGDGGESQLTGRFRNYLRTIRSLSINPWKMPPVPADLVSNPEDDLSDLVAWLGWVIEHGAEGIEQLRGELPSIIECCTSIELREIPQAKFVVFGVECPPPAELQSVEFAITELSEGQRVLLALYAILHLMIRPGTTICIDEPDNFVALAEVEPWLQLVQEKCEENGAQVILVSHHPEIINRLAGRYGALVARTPNGATSVKPFVMPEDSALPPAELVARGWLDE